MDWEVLGPDMTRANRIRPEGEGPNTSYHALLSIAESPRSGQVIWTGSDDGLVWLTRDYGRTWTNVTGNFPAGAPTHCFVSTIAASHHADGAAYLTYDCHHRDDYRPHVYKTTNFGRSWTPITAGLPVDGGSLTVFEDPYNPRLVWVGTVSGAYVTVDGGASWHRFGRNLPPVQVEKFALSYGQRELVVGTHGRGVWVLGVAPLEEMTGSLLSEPSHLFRVPPALQYRYAHTYPAFGSRPFTARNPAPAATISYYLRDALTGPVDVYVTTAQGDTIRKLSGSAYAGLNEVTWDLSSTKPRPRALRGPTTPAELKRVLAGTYTVRMKVESRKLSQPIRVEDWSDGPHGPPR